MTGPGDLPRRRFLGLLGATGMLGIPSLSGGGPLVGTGSTALPGPRRWCDSDRPSSASLVVETAAGPIRGYQDDGAKVFKGVPYAAPPTGGLRFKPPIPPARWASVRDATSFGPAAPQEELFPQFPVTSEQDCLTVNVWSPDTDCRRRPVMVWALDGAHMLGFPEMVDGLALARTHDVVIVSVGVRVGALGYAWLGDVLGDGYATSGNLGSLDYQLALRWVQDNIERFGGDPGCVTAFGISGAGGSALALMAMPSARGLFHRAILQSADQTLFRTTDEAGYTTDALMRALGLGPGTYGQILTMPVEQLIEGQVQVLHTPRPLDQATWFGAVVGPVLPEHPLDALRHGASKHVEVITGSVRDEFTYQMGTAPSVAALGEPGARALFEAVFPGEGGHAVDAYRSYYSLDEWPFLVGALWGDYQFGFGGVRLARARHGTGAKTWIYHFVWPSPVAGPYGARHGVDWAFALDTLATGGGGVPIGDDPPQALADLMTGAWTRFARAGYPDDGWRRYNPRHAPAMILDAEPHAEHDDPLAPLRGFWERSRRGIDMSVPPVWPSV